MSVGNEVGGILTHLWACAPGKRHRPRLAAELYAPARGGRHSVPAEHRPGRENVQHLVSYVREHRLVCVCARIYACTRIYTCDMHVAHVCVCVCACSIEPHTYALFGHDEEGRPVLCDLGGPRGLMSQTEKRRRACAFAWTRTRQLAAPSAP